MKKLLLLVISMLMLGSCGTAVKNSKTSAVLVKYNIGVSEKFEADDERQSVTETAIKEFSTYKQVRFVDRRNLKAILAKKSAEMAIDSSNTQKLEDPIQYFMTGSVLSLGQKKIIRLSLLNVQNSVIEASVTFSFIDAKELPGQMTEAVAELMQAFAGTEK